MSLTSHHLFFIQKHHYLTNEFRFLALVMFWHILFTTQYTKYSYSSCYNYKNVFLVWKKKTARTNTAMWLALVYIYPPFIAFLEYSDRDYVLHSYTKMSIKIILQRQLQIDLCVIICWVFFCKETDKRRKITREDVFIIYLTTEQTCIILTKCFRSKKVTVYTYTIRRYKTISQLM